MIEEYKPYIERLLLNEPWRANEGEGDSLCDGNLDWDGSVFWKCKGCDRIGRSPFVLHKPLRMGDVKRRQANFLRAFAEAVYRHFHGTP